MSDNIQFKPIHPIASILNHLRLIVALTLVLTVILATVILIKVKPVYTSYSGVEVTLLHSRMLAWDPEKQFSSRSQYTDYINTQVRYLISFENMKAALARLELPNKALTPGENDAETVLLYQRKINAQPVRNTHLINISANDTQPEDLDTLVNAVIDAFMERQKAVELGKNDNRIAHLRKELEARQAELADQNEQLTRLTLDLGSMNINQETNPNDQVLSQLRDALTRAAIERISAENDYNAQLEAIESQKAMSFAPLVEEYIYQDLNTVDMKNRTFQFREELNRQAANLKPNHPNSKQLQEQMAESEKYLEESLQKSREKANLIIEGKSAIERQKLLSEARADYVARLNTEKDILNRYNQEKAELNKSIPIYQQAKQLSSNIERIRSRIIQIETRLDELVIEAKAPGRLKIQSRARQPIYPTKDRRKMFLAMALAFSLTTALLAAFAIDYFKPTIIDPQHMAQIIGTRPTGVLTRWDGDPDSGQLMHSAPNSFHADRFRRILPRIFSSPTSPENPAVFAVISILEGHGAMSFALNTVKALDNAGRHCGMLELTTGVGTLPNRTTKWGLEKNPLNSEHAASLPITCMTGENAEFYYFHEPCARENLADQFKMGSLLKSLADRTGCLIVSGPPLFQNSEAELLCRQADVVVLVVDGPKTSPSELKRAIAMLRELKVEKCAVIANNLPILPGGYFTQAQADYEGRTLKYPLVKDVIAAIKRAMPWTSGPEKRVRG